MFVVRKLYDVQSKTSQPQLLEVVSVYGLIVCSSVLYNASSNTDW